jgi:hypothetical protein
VTLSQREGATIVATGTISYGSQHPACSGSVIPPEGCGAETICPVSRGCGALVGRLGDGPPELRPSRACPGPFVGLASAVAAPAAVTGDLTGDRRR